VFSIKIRRKTICSNQKAYTTKGKNVSIKKACKATGKPVFSIKKLVKPKENKCFQSKSSYFLRKSNVLGKIVKQK